MFRCPVLEFEKMETHITICHPLACYACTQYHLNYDLDENGDRWHHRCNKLFINHKTYHEHTHYMRHKVFPE
jgi:hypothetical protein